MNKLLTFLTGAVLVAVICTYGAMNVFHYTAGIESDSASEALLAEVMYENGLWQPDTWNISTGYRTISAPKLAAIIYPMTGHNLNLSMGIACTALVVLLALSMLFFYRKLQLSWLESLCAILLTFILVSPTSELVKMLFFQAAYYSSHFICMFLILGLYAEAVRKDRVSVAVIAFTSVLAVLNSMQGMHASLFCYVPLLATELVRRIWLFYQEKKTDKTITIWIVLITAIAYFGTRIFGSYRAENSRNIRHAAEKFNEYVLPCFKAVLSFDRLGILVYFFVVVAIIGYALAFIRLLNGRDKENTAAFTILWGLLATVLSTTFTTAETSPRYYCLELFAVGSGIALFMHYFFEKVSDVVSVPVIAYGIVTITAFANAYFGGESAYEAENRQVIDWMAERGYEHGYSTFDYANMLTVLGGNNIKIRPVNNMADVEGSKWLSDKTWYPPFISSDGATCYIVSEANAEDFDSFLQEKNPEIIERKEINNFVVFVLDHDYTVWVD